MGGAKDGLIWSYRHGNRTAGSRPDSKRANFLFFDGHVETLGNRESMNPKFWSPKGTELLITMSTAKNGGQMWTDVHDQLIPAVASGSTYIVP